MINPKTILAEWVTALQALPRLVEALGGNANRIQFYSENAVVFGQPTQNNMRLAILSMPPGSILIAWQGSGPARLGNALVFAHDFSLYLRAPEEADVGYEDLFNLIVNDVPGSGDLRMLHTPIDPELRADGLLPAVGQAQHHRDQRGRSYVRVLRMPRAADRVFQSVIFQEETHGRCGIYALAIHRRGQSSRRISGIAVTLDVAGLDAGACASRHERSGSD